MTHGSLFSGIGGFDLAAEWMGWTNVFHCEWNPFGQKVLKHYWPDAISYTDITKTNFSKHYGTIDIISGGFPCQPYSTAGKRLGKEDERHLWPEMLRAIREVSPRYVVGENVRGLTNWDGGVVFDEVQADLEAEGYEVLPFLLPACGVGAPHRRDRIWFIAHAHRHVHSGGLGNGRYTEEAGGSEGINSSEGKAPFGQRLRAKLGAGGEATANPQRNIGGVRLDMEGNGWEKEAQQARMGGISNAADTEGIGMGRAKELENHSGQGGEWRGCNTNHPYEVRSKADWSDWPTVAPLCTRDDGISFGLDDSAIRFKDWRDESIKAAGNAVVPQVVYQIFRAIAQYEVLNSEQNQRGSVATDAAHRSEP